MIEGCEDADFEQLGHDPAAQGSILMRLGRELAVERAHENWTARPVGSRQNDSEPPFGARGKQSRRPYES